MYSNKYMVICGTTAGMRGLLYKWHLAIWLSIIIYKYCSISCYRLSLMAWPACS